MIDQPIEQFLRQTPRRQPPNYISLPFATETLPAKQTSRPADKRNSQHPLDLSSAPRPPVPPRRHTLAEICRYADEQCAYIEWMTRQLEAEEAARRHSSPTTPMGAITNPFSGPADMWWRPVSANEMYGKSVLRRQQEEEQERNQRQNPYLATSGFSDLVEKESRVEKTRKDNTYTDIEEANTTTKVLPVPLTHEPSEIDEDPTTKTDPEIDKFEDLPTSIPNSMCKREARWDLTRAYGTRIHSSNDRGLELPNSGRSSIFLMIPKAMLCLLLLPLVLVVLCSTIGCDVDSEERRERG